jgi:hypothetical protein
MMKPRFQWLLHPVFLLSLLVLLANDFYLKYAYGNWITGKLSDISGLIAFTVFLFAFLPFDRKKIVIGVSLFFIWWKSPLSEPVISFFNTTCSLPVTRVVDYTDLIALCFLPFTLNLRIPPITPSTWRSAVITASGLISFFAFCATSMPFSSWYEKYREDEIPFPEIFKTKMTDKEILYKLDPQHKGWTIDSVRFLPSRGYARPYYQIRKPGDSTTQWTQLPDSIPWPLYFRSASQPFYIIPEYILDRDTLLGLEFTISNGSTKSNSRNVSFRSFRMRDQQKFAQFYNNPLYKKYKKHFKKLLRGK